jgi:hypothetical protein
LRRKSCFAGLTLVLACCLAPQSAQAVKSRWVLTQESEAVFKTVLTAAQTGKLGPGVKNANITILGEKVRIELVLTTGKKGFVLTHPPAEGASQPPRFFTLAPDADAVRADAARLIAILDEVFTSDPWLEPVDWFNHDPVIKGGAPVDPYRRDGFRGLVASLGRRFVSHASRRFTIGLLAVLISLLAGGTTMLWRARPDRSS